MQSSFFLKLSSLFSKGFGLRTSGQRDEEKLVVPLK